jgi:hypothetical protein
MARLGKRVAVNRQNNVVPFAHAPSASLDASRRVQVGGFEIC